MSFRLERQPSLLATTFQLDIYLKNTLVLLHVKKKKKHISRPSFAYLSNHLEHLPSFPSLQTPTTTFSTDSYTARPRLPNPSRPLSFASRYWPRARAPEPGGCPGGVEFHSQGCSVHSSRRLPWGLPLSGAAGCPPERKVNKCEVWAGPPLLPVLCALYLWL